MALLATLRVAAQFVQGVVTDEAGVPLPGVHVCYQADKRTVVSTDIDGKYKIAFRKGDLVFTMMGFDTKIVGVKGAQTLNVKLKESLSSMKEVDIAAKRKKYVRKDNPAVLLMQKVIEAKKASDLHQHDYCSYMKYEKMTTALNEFTPKVFEDDHFKRFPFLKDHVETCAETGKLILPLIVDEKVSRIIYRKSSNTEKSIVVGQRSEGINDFLNTGDIISSLLTDCFTDVDIYKNDVRLLQYPFLSPISSSGAIRFYRYYLSDTLMIDKDKCYQVDFIPNNPQDFGFSGTLWIMADSTYRVRRAHLGIPSRSDVNFVEHMDIVQEFESLPTGEQVVTNNKMIIQLKLASWLQKAQVERTVKYSGFDFSSIPDRTFKFAGNTKVESSAQMRDEEFWEEQRPAPLTKSEGQMGDFMKRIQNIKGFKEVLWVAKAFIENFVETSVDPKHPSKVDIGPVNTMIGSNWVEGFKLRASAQTTANLSKHWFAKGYVKYGFGDQRWKGQGELTYSFNPKDYLPREYPVNNLTISYTNDVMSPSDKFLPTDKDNVFVAWKWSKVSHMNYFERFNILWDKEWENGLRFNAQVRREWNEGAGDLFYVPLSQGITNADGQLVPDLATLNANPRSRLTFSEATLALQYQPGATYTNTKQRRLSTNFDSPIYGISHTMGIKGFLGGQYNYNFTEATLYKRFWLRSWGKIDCMLKGGAQWNKVPFPFLCMPAANLSYIMEDNTFNLINNMEFLNDRYASLMLSWDLNGKLLNRIPLLKKLKWREYFGCNMLWGTLTDKNNPFLPQNQGDDQLFFFPFDDQGNPISHVMDKKKPYVELIAGIHNIFKILHVEYVHRVNYLDFCKQKWGIRITFRATF